MTNRLFALLITFCLPVFSFLQAQDCYQKALQKGYNFYLKGNNEKAREAWEEGKKCPDANTAKLDEAIRRLDDFDLDGIPNKQDKCMEEFGAKETDGCPCADVYKWKGIDHYYDNQPDSAMLSFSLANKCSDATEANEIAAWQSKVSTKALPNGAAAQSKEEVYKVVEQKPEYPGGEKQMLQFIFENIHYPAIARANGVEGTVYVRFVIEKDGQVSHVEVIRDVGAGTGKEAARVVRTMPPWEPGMQNGKPVRVYFNLPVKYKLD